MTIRNRLPLDPNEPNLSRIWQTYEGIIDADVLEDRREYVTEDLQKAYDLNTLEAIYLERLIQSNFDPEAESLYRSHWTDEDAQNLAECVTESIHQGLDGWDDRDKAVITLYLHDLGLALKAMKAS
jgi:hypothetical protein